MSEATSFITESSIKKYISQSKRRLRNCGVSIQEVTKTPLGFNIEGTLINGQRQLFIYVMSSPFDVRLN